jgi:hypothetical protein
MIKVNRQVTAQLGGGAGNEDEIPDFEEISRQ